MNGQQLELDTRSGFQRAISELTVNAIFDAYKLVRTSSETATEKIMPETVHNRYEAYGVAAEQMVKIKTAVKVIEKDVTQLLGTLTNPQESALEATSNIANSAGAAASVLILAAAIIKKTTDSLYVEEAEIVKTTPLEELIEPADFEDAETIEEEK